MRILFLFHADANTDDVYLIPEPKSNSLKRAEYGTLKRYKRNLKQKFAITFWAELFKGWLILTLG